MSIVVRDSTARARRWMAERTGRAIPAIGAAMLLAYLSATVLLPKPGGRVVFGDATHHFVQLRSMVFDRDLNFRNDYLGIYGLTQYEPGTEWLFTEFTPTGYVRNYMPVGPALLWAPLYLLVAGVQLLLSVAGLAPRPDGFDRVLQMTPGATGVIAATMAAWFSWRLARRWTDPASAGVGVIAVWLGSSALYYSLISPSYSHSASMFATSLFFWHWLGDGGVFHRLGSSGARDGSDHRHRVSPNGGKHLRPLTLGALAGFASLMRWQDALLLAIPVFEALRSSPSSWPRRVLAAAAAVLAWFVVFSPQMVVWHVLYGRAFALPQGPSFLQWLAPHPLAVLFSENHGLFTWTPLAVLSVWGLAKFATGHRRFALPLAGFVLASWYVNAAVADWWAGEAFGARRFLSLFPLFVLGLATWLTSQSRPGDFVPPDPLAPSLAGAPCPAPLRLGASATRRLIAVAVLVAVTWLLLFQYELFMKGYTSVAPYPRGGVHFWLDRFVVPFRLVARWFM